MTPPTPHTCEASLKLLADFWHLRIIEALAMHKTLRYCELQRALDDVNPATLTKKLTVLEKADIIERQAATDHHVAYTLTALGKKTLPVLRAIKTFSQFAQ